MDTKLQSSNVDNFVVDKGGELVVVIVNEVEVEKSEGLTRLR